MSDLVPLLVAGVAHGVVIMPPGALAGARGLTVAVSAPIIVVIIIIIVFVVITPPRKSKT